MIRSQFDPHQPHQASAVGTVTDLFDGQPADADQLMTTFWSLSSEPALFDRAEVFGQVSLDIATEVGVMSNGLMLDEDTVPANSRWVQDRSGLGSAQVFADGLQLDMEMETGMDKTYVYSRIVFELAKRYRFTKFIILMPSMTVRKSVKTSIDLIREHFRHLYPETNMDASVYTGERAEEVRDFVPTTGLQLLVMTTNPLRRDRNARIMYQNRDKLAGSRPLSHLWVTHPTVITGKPQNMESMLAQLAVADLDPLCTLRHLAAHRVTCSVVYRLDPSDARQLGLVKTIVVSDVQELGGSAKLYVKLPRVSRDLFKASLELICRKKDRSYAKRKVIAAQGDNLERIFGSNLAYEGSQRISKISVEPECVELSNYGYLLVGDEIGSNQDAVFKEMIRKTIRECIRKELQIHVRGIKVLSLLFTDEAVLYLGDGANGLNANDGFITRLDRLHTEELGHQPGARDVVPATALDARSGYLVQVKSSRGKNAVMTFEDSSGKTKADDDAYELTMHDKARLLSVDEPTRFTFSHSALHEGWDNPGAFQVCTLCDMASETEHRQTIGRGPRLPVNRDGEYISDTGPVQLTVMSNGSYKAFALALQNECQKAGAAIEFARKQEFSCLLITVDGKEIVLGAKWLTKIWDHLHWCGFINEQGEVQGSWGSEQLGFIVDLPEPHVECEDDVINIVNACKMGTIIRRKRKRVTRKLNEGLHVAPGLEEFWDKTTQHATYRVSFERQVLADVCVDRTETALRTELIHIQVARTKMTMTHGDIEGNTLRSRGADLTGSYSLPGVVAQLQGATPLTWRVIIDILIGLGRLGESLGSPNDFVEMATVCIQEELAHAVIEDIQCEEIGGSIYELRELQEDGLEKKDHFLDRLYRVTNMDKMGFDYVVFDSMIERQSAECLGGSEDIHLFMKPSNEFRIPTPVGDYDLDWTIIRTEDGQDRPYLIRGAESNLDPTGRRPGENTKINVAIKRFKATGVNHKAAAPDNRGL